MTPDDALYSQAVDLVITRQSASVSMLQRRLRIGFWQASGYLDEMQALGIVSAPPNRTVLIRDEIGSGNHDAHAERADSTRRSAAQKENDSLHRVDATAKG